MHNSVYTYEYSQEYSPSMPVVKVGVSDPAVSEPGVTVSMLVDSGADGRIAFVGSDFLAAGGYRIGCVSLCLYLPRTGAIPPRGLGFWCLHGTKSQ